MLSLYILQQKQRAYHSKSNRQSLVPDSISVTLVQAINVKTYLFTYSESFNTALLAIS